MVRILRLPCPSAPGIPRWVGVARCRFRNRAPKGSGPLCLRHLPRVRDGNSAAWTPSESPAFAGMTFGGPRVTTRVANSIGDFYAFYCAVVTGHGVGYVSAFEGWAGGAGGGVELVAVAGYYFGVGADVDEHDRSRLAGRWRLLGGRRRRRSRCGRRLGGRCRCWRWGLCGCRARGLVC